MVKIKTIKKKKYKGNVFDITLKNDKNPYFFANNILSHNSLYPFITIQCNLFGRKKEGTGWTGGDKWKIDGVYDDKKMSKVCELFKKFYEDRLVYKKNKDRKEYSIKIILNTGSYGILNTPYYPKVFDAVAGRDCPTIGRQWVKYARKVFRDNGYKVIYTDTDSIYIILSEGQTKESMLKVKDKIIADIKATVPFPQERFDMGIDDEIKAMYFFKGDKISGDKDEMDSEDEKNKSLSIMKKNYIYVRKDNSVVVKNLGVRKKSTSALTRKLFWDILVPEIISKGTVKFSKATLKNNIQELLEKDLTLAAMRKDVDDFSKYAEKSPTSLPAQITKRYGSGIWFMIPNTRRLGVGKSKHYCTIEEFKENGLGIDSIDLSNIWKELEYFIKPYVSKNIFDFSK